MSSNWKTMFSSLFCGSTYAANSASLCVNGVSPTVIRSCSGAKMIGSGEIHDKTGLTGENLRVHLFDVFVNSWSEGYQ